MFGGFITRLIAPLAVLFGSVGFVFPAAVSRRTLRFETRLMALLRLAQDPNRKSEPSARRVHLTRMLGAWGALLGLAGVFAPTVYIWMVVASYAVGTVVGLTYLAFRLARDGNGLTVVR